MAREFVWTRSLITEVADQQGPRTIGSFIRTDTQNNNVLERVLFRFSMGFSAFRDDTLVLPPQSHMAIQGDVSLGLTGFPTEHETGLTDLPYRQGFFLPVLPTVVQTSAIGPIPASWTMWQSNSMVFEHDMKIRRRMDADSLVTLEWELDTPIEEWENVDRSPLPPRCVLSGLFRVLWSHDV